MFLYLLYDVLAVFFLTFMVSLYVSVITISDQFCLTDVREVPGSPATFKMELFVTLVNGLQPLTNLSKSSILNVSGYLDAPLIEA